MEQSAAPIVMTQNLVCVGLRSVAEASHFVLNLVAAVVAPQVEIVVVTAAAAVAVVVVPVAAWRLHEAPW